MTRLLTQTFEPGTFTVSGTRLAADTAQKIEGTQSLKAVGDSGHIDFAGVPAGVLDRHYYARLYIRIGAFPAIDFPFRMLTFETGDGASAWGFPLMLSNGGKLESRDANFVQVFISGSALAFNTWHCLEVHVQVTAGNDTLEIKQNGTTIFSSVNVANHFFGNAPGGWVLNNSFGNWNAQGDAGNLIVWYDAFAVNNDQGATDNSWVGQISSGQIAQAIGLASGANTALPLGRRKQKAIGVAVDLSTTFAFTRRKRKDIGLPTETDTSLGLTKRKLRAIYATGGASEINLAFALTKRKRKAIELLTETDTVHALARRRQRPIGLASEADSALHIPSRIAVAIEPAQETNNALALTRRKQRAVAIASTADEPLSVSERKSRPIGLSSTAETSQALSRRRNKPISVAVETESGLILVERKTLPIGVAMEDDSALSATSEVTIARAIGIAETNETAISLDSRKRKPINVGIEQDTVTPNTIVNGQFKDGSAPWHFATGDMIIHDGAPRLIPDGSGDWGWHFHVQDPGDGGFRAPYLTRADKFEDVVGNRWYTSELSYHVVEPSEVYGPRMYHVYYSSALELLTVEQEDVDNNDEAYIGQRMHRSYSTKSPPGAAYAAVYYGALVSSPNDVIEYYITNLTWRETSAFTARKTKPIAIASAVDGGVSITRRKSAPIAGAQVTEGALAFVRQRLARLGTASEADIAGVMSRLTRKPIAPASELDRAGIALGRSLALEIGLAEETDTALPIHAAYTEGEVDMTLLAYAQTQLRIYASQQTELELHAS